ncbi:myelin-oligodendrocyte glycoprotein-like [Esox lucius]|uniref:myelin-oligodendrocyte glycoprotein-like n=1 Tax=Esox lucius TaxID=8010 RepID=UPI001477498D|nr:myelin-oligodendrocyte glycoprotein-like [Esox lucius]
MQTGSCLKMVILAVLNISITKQNSDAFSVSAPHVSVTAWPGSSVILPCELSPTFDAKPLKVCWYRHDNFFTYKPALFYKDHKTQEDFVDPHYRGRVSLIGELEKGNLSLRLERVTPEDRGEYVCCVSSEQCIDKARVFLTINGK